MATLQDRINQLSPPKIEIHHWHFLKKGAAWTTAKGNVNKLYEA